MRFLRVGLGRHVALAAALIILDQLVKLLVIHGWRSSNQAFHIVFVKNTGAGFGLFQGTNIILIAVSVIVLAVIVRAWAQSNERIFLTFIIAGILGNLIDRIRLGFVVDWFDLGWFPVFNVADSCISIGVACFVILSAYREFWNKKKRARVR